MESLLLLPNVVTGLVPSLRNKLQVCFENCLCRTRSIVQNLADDSSGLVLVVRLSNEVLSKAEKGQGTKRGSIVLRAAPRSGVDGSVRVEFGRSQVSIMDEGLALVLAREGHKVPHHTLHRVGAEGGIANPQGGQ